MNSQRLGDRLEFMVHSAPEWGHQFAIHIRDRSENSSRQWIASEIVFKEKTPEEYGQYRPPALRLSKDEAQQLMDQLWRCGIRPTESYGGNCEVVALTHHLEDMRALVFKTQVQPKPSLK